jgi:hypothetical protein
MQRKTIESDHPAAVGERSKHPRPFMREALTGICA